MKILNKTCKEELSIKRAYLPIYITDECPGCGMTATASESKEYFSYPVLNAPTEVRFYCSSWDSESGEHGCEKEWTQKIVLSVAAEAYDGV